MAKHISGRQRIARFSGLSTGRYRQLRIEEAEPNLGFPTEKTLPLKPNYYQLVTFDDGDTYDRYWQVPPVGFNSIGLSIFDEDFIVGTGNSITRLNFKGNSIIATAENFSNISTITVSPPGNNTEVLFKNNGDFATSSGFTFDPLDPLLTIEAELKVGAGGTIITALDDARVGIATTQPERTLHINGDMRLTGTIYDYYNNSGTVEPSVLVSNAFGGVEWLPNDELSFFSVGPVYGVQYKSATGTVVSAETFYYNPFTERVGVGTSTPRQTFDLRGDALLEGNIFVSGITTFNNNVEFQSNIQSNFIPTANNTYDLGSSSLRWNNLYANTLQSIDVDTNTLDVNGLITLSGITSISGSLYPETDATYQLGFEDFRWNDINSVNGNFSGSVTIGDADTDLAVFNASIGSNLIPDTVSNRDIGDAFFKWRTIYADTIDAVSLKANTLLTENDNTNLNRFLTFVPDDNSVEADYESYFTNSSLYYNPGSTTLFVSNLIVSGITTFQDTVVIGNDTNDTVRIVSKVDTNIIPNADQTYNLGSNTLKWGDVYGLTFSGNAASATQLETGRLFSITGDADASSVFFDGTANVGLALTLVDTGVTANTYGSSTTVPQITVDTKGRITSAVSVGIDFANATVAQANSVLSQSTSNVAYFYPSFLDSNNNTPDYEQLYTNVFLAYQPSTGNFGIGNSEPTAKLHVSGEPRFDIMTTFQDEGSIRFDRQDATSRPFYIRTYNDSTPGGNYMGFDVHNGSTGNASRVLTLRGDGNVGINSVDPTDKFFVGGTLRVTDNATFENDVSIRGALIDSSFDSGTNGQVLLSTGTGTNWSNQSNIAAGTADQIRTQRRTNNATHYITFVDSDNSPAEYENLYTADGASNGGVTFNPSSGVMNIISPDSIPLVLERKNTGVSAIEYKNSSGSMWAGLVNFADWWAIDGDSDLSNDPYLIVNRTDGKVGIGTTQIDAISRVSIAGTMSPSITEVHNLGTPDLKWNTVWASTIDADLVGNADTATALETARNFSLGNDLTSPTVSFDGTSNVVLNGNLVNTGVTSATYGTEIEIPVFSVDAKGRITSVTNTNVNFAEAQVAKADSLTTSRNFSLGNDLTSPIVSFNGTDDVVLNGNLVNTGVTSFTYGSSTEVPVFDVDAKGRITGVTNTSIDFGNATALNADNILTQSSSSFSTHYLTFVDSNNSPAAYETVYTDSSISFTPSSDLLSLTGGITVGGISTFSDVLHVKVPTIVNSVGSVLNSHLISRFVNISSDNAERGLEIGAPSTNVTGPSYLKVYGTSSRFAILDQYDNENLTIFDDVINSGRFGLVGIGSTLPKEKLDVDGNVVPSVDSTHDLGGASNKWDNVYANTFNGSFVGNADTASQVSTGTTTGTTSYYLTFVDSNNGTRQNESLYTDAGIVYNPSSNSLGIGTTNPTSKLQVEGGAYINNGSLEVSDGSSPTLWLDAKDSNWPAIIFKGKPVGGSAGTQMGSVGFGGFTNQELEIWSEGTVALKSTSYSSTDGLFVNNNKVGIGTTLPKEKLDVDGNVVPSVDSTHDLGGASNKWDNVYANTFNGSFVGNADTATALESAQNFSLGNDLTSPTVSFDGTSGVVLNGNLVNTGVTSATYGTDSKVVQISVDAKGRITSAQELDINFSAATVGFADALTNARNFSLGNDLTSPTVSFDGTSDVVLNGNLVNTGVTSATYGSATLIPVFDVDAKGRITGVTNTGVNFGAATVAQADKVKVYSENTGTTERYLCFADGGGSNYQDIKIDTGIRWVPTDNDLIVFGDIVAGRNSGGVALTNNDSQGNANITFNHQNGVPEQNGNAARIVCNTDGTTNAYLDFYVKSGVTGGTTVSLTNVIRINESGLIPVTDSTFDLGGTSNRWNHIYADNITATNINAPISGNADTATKLSNARNFSVSGDVTTASPVSFDGTADVDLAVSLPTIPGLTAGTYGSATEIPTITVNNKGKVTAVSVNTFTPANSQTSDALLTQTNTTNANYYPTFVNSNNAAPGTAESYFTTDKFTINPSNGNLVVSGTVTANSDARLKDNVKQIDNALDKVLSLRGVEYDRNDLEDNPHQIGVIAQEVEKVFPELVNGQGDEIKSVAYGNFAGVFIEAFKEQQKTIEEQNAKIDLLTKQVEALMEKLGG